VTKHCLMLWTISSFRISSVINGNSHMLCEIFMSLSIPFMMNESSMRRNIIIPSLLLLIRFTRFSIFAEFKYMEGFSILMPIQDIT